MTRNATLKGLVLSAKELLAESPSDATLYQEEVLSLEKDRPDARLTQEEFDSKLRAHELKQITDIIAARKTYAEKVFVLVRNWLIAVLAILLVQGIAQIFCEKSFLSDHVLMALIGGTTLNVIGIFTIVANFLFPKNGHSFFSREAAKKTSKTKKKVKTSKPDDV